MAPYAVSYSHVLFLAKLKEALSSVLYERAGLEPKLDKALTDYNETLKANFNKSSSTVTPFELRKADFTQSQAILNKLSESCLREVAVIGEQLNSDDPKLYSTSGLRGIENYFKEYQEKRQAIANKVNQNDAVISYIYQSHPQELAVSGDIDKKYLYLERHFLHKVCFYEKPEDGTVHVNHGYMAGIKSANSFGEVLKQYLEINPSRCDTFIFPDDILTLKLKNSETTIKAQVVKYSHSTGQVDLRNEKKQAGAYQARVQTLYLDRDFLVQATERVNPIWELIEACFEKLVEGC